MSGPRVTSGLDSKQDYQSPADFMAAIKSRFGEIQFDLAAHRMNKQHERYFAPAVLSMAFDPAKTPPGAMTVTLVQQGGDPNEVAQAVEKAVALNEKTIVAVANHDSNAQAFDAFKQSWAACSRSYAVNGKPGLLYLNCEFNDCAAWAMRCGVEAKYGANIVLLTPAITGANWSRDLIFGKADVYLCNGRLMFDGKNVYPKDCMASHFYPGATGQIFIWEWKRDVIHHAWRRYD